MSKAELIKLAKYELEVYKHVKPETAQKMIKELEGDRVFVVNKPK